jgi:hypothetical protein
MKKRHEIHDQLAAEEQRKQLATEERREMALERRENERQLSHLLHIMQEEHKKGRGCKKPFGLWFI